MARSTLLLVLPLVLLSAVGCCTDPVTGGLYFCLTDMNDVQEAQLGAEYAPNFVAQSGGTRPRGWRTRPSWPG